MALSMKVSRSDAWLLFSTLIIAAASAACSSEPDSCNAQRCSESSSDAAGAQSGGNSGGAAHRFGGTSGTSAAGASGENQPASPGASQAGASGASQAGASGASQAGASGTSQAGASGTSQAGAPTVDDDGVTETGGTGSVACNALEQGASTVSPELLPGAMPVETQGKVVSGTYFLTKYQSFSSSTAIDVASTISVAVHGSVAVVQGVLEVDGVGLARFTGTLKTNRPTASFHSCQNPAGFPLLPPLNAPVPTDYTASPGALVLSFPEGQFDRGYRLTFTRQ